MSKKMETEKSAPAIFYDLIKKIGIYNIAIVVIFPILIGILLYKLKPTMVLDYPDVKVENMNESFVCFKPTCNSNDYEKVNDIKESIRLGEGKVSMIKVIGYTTAITIVFYIFLYLNSIFNKN